MTEKANGKAKDDGFEEVEGKSPDKRASIVGLRVKSVNTTEDDEGGANATMTIAGRAHGMTRVVGETIQIETMDGVRRMSAHVRSVTISEAKDQGLRDVALKATGGRELVDLVGRQVKVVKAQGELPGIQEAVEEEEGPAPVGAVEHFTEGTPRRQRGKGRRARAPEASA